MKIDNERNSLRRTVGIGAPMPARPRAHTAVAPRPLQEVRLTELGHSFQKNMVPLATKVLDASALVRFQNNVGGVASPPPPSSPSDRDKLLPPESYEDTFDKLQELAEDAEIPDGLDLAAEDVDVLNEQLEIARTATAELDYGAALEAYQALGFPVDAANVSDEALATLVLLGVADGDTGEFSTDDETFQELQGLALNAQLMVAMADAGVPPTENPPTREEAELYMQALVAQGATTDELFAAASAFVEGTVVLYGHAGLTEDPDYGAEEVRYVVMHGSDRYEYGAGEENMEKASAKAKDLGVGFVVSASTLPDTWADAYSQDGSGARHIGDCENTLYLMHQLLSFAGIEAVGSVMISGDEDQTAHMTGVFYDGSDYYVTSNFDYAQVESRSIFVTNANVENAVKAAAYDIYETNEGLTYGYAKQPEGAAGDPGVESMRRAQEYAHLGYEEELL
ncbi:MAG: hypothetical protein RIT81_18610 [Deltaproteobacteria bacterium]